jgi:hypothetical protein
MGQVSRWSQLLTRGISQGLKLLIDFRETERPKAKALGYLEAGSSKTLVS